MHRDWSTVKRALAASLVAVAVLLVLAPTAAASGDGLLGPITDKDITYWGFAVIGLFILLPIVLTLIQIRLERRKERIREQLDRVRRP